MPIIHLIVKHENSTLFDEGIPIDEDITIENLFTTIASDTFEPELWDEEFEAYFGNTKFGNKEKVRKTCKVYEASSIYGIFMEIRIVNNLNNDEEQPFRQNAFDLLMKASSTLCLSEFNSRNALDQLKIDISNLIKENRAGWFGYDVAKSTGKKFITDLANAIWYVDIRGFDVFN